uniref:Ripening-related protein 4 n=1 Tax=Aegilops tauschii TaxID=37682 RepID=M8BPT4_AEGTA
MANLKMLLAMFALVMFLSHLRVHGVSAPVASANVTTETSHRHDKCHISGFLRGKSGDYIRDHGSVCCKDASHEVETAATNHSARTASTRTPSWRGRCPPGLCLDGKRRCNKMIHINGNGRAVLSKVVDECDSVYGCDTEHNFEPLCPYNDVDASPAVWKALGLKEEIGVFKIT